MSEPMEEPRRSKRLKVKHLTYNFNLKLTKGKPQKTLNVKRIKQRPQKEVTVNSIKGDPQEDLSFNLTREHPLLNGLILENIFGYLKGEKNATTLAGYRTVCKTWDTEIVKLLRKDTQIDLSKILAPYPTGMGWISTPQNSEMLFDYKIPYPAARQFPNIVVTADSCENLKNEKWVKWFQIMGSEIKSLKFSSPLTCFCQNKFLESILKEWCPNLESLELRDVKCVDGLLLMSSFLQKSVPFLCKNLKDLGVFINGGEEPYSLCADRDSTYANVHVLDINIRKLCLKFSTWKVVNFIHEFSLNSNNGNAFPEIVNTSGKKVKLQIPLNQNEGLPNLSTYFADHLKPTDGGIIGQIMKEIKVEKFQIHGLSEISHGQDFVMFFHIRTNIWRSSLKHLELNEFLSKSIKELHVIAQCGFPLTTIKLGGIHLSRDNEEMTKFLNYFANTLEHLEIDGPAVREDNREESSKLILPVLPKLKKFVHGNVQVCYLTASNLFMNAPNLETCYLEGRLSQQWTFWRFFDTNLKISNSSLKGLKIIAPCIGTQARLLLRWFPNLTKLELGFRFFGGSSNCFFDQLEKSKVEHLKFSFLSYQALWGKQLDQLKTAVLWKNTNIKKLKSLEITNMTDFPCHITAGLFPKRKTQLTSLKLNDLCMVKNKKKELLNGLSHIPCVEMIN